MFNLIKSSIGIFKRIRLSTDFFLLSTKLLMHVICLTELSLILLAKELFFLPPPLLFNQMQLSLFPPEKRLYLDLLPLRFKPKKMIPQRPQKNQPLLLDLLNRTKLILTLMMMNPTLI